ncbi:MAG: uracil-DNA glycosylase [Ruminococcaceae bacterium]|nr:uracil-DNA glycosylase [Oscillospiraceae bacterium]
MNPATDSWEQLLRTCSDCTACELHKTRTNCVFGTGNKNADLLFVGEAPGEQEDKTGTPFVGRAGQLLDQYLYAVDIPRDSVYIANILKCRPPKNRDPLPAEEDACIDYLRRQVRLIRPKIIVCLGRIAAMRLIKPDFRITKEHGIWFEKGNFLITAVYHPALLLRDPRKKEEMLLDMKQIKEKLDLLSEEFTQ